MNTPATITPRAIWGWATVALLAVGSIGPWVTFGPFSASGTSGDGVVTIIVAALAAVLIGIGKAPIGVAVLGLLALATGIYDVTQVSSSGNEYFSATVGWGLILATLASASLVGWGVVTRRGRA